MKFILYFPGTVTKEVQYINMAPSKHEARLSLRKMPRKKLTEERKKIQTEGI